MHSLRRIVRANITHGPPGSVPGHEHPSRNGYAGVPASQGLSTFYEFEARCVGDPDPGTDYLVDIKDVDRAIRSVVVPEVRRALSDEPGIEPHGLLRSVLEPLSVALPASLASLIWRLSPYHEIEMQPETPDIALVRTRFDFAAAHRLHRPELSDDQNRDLYGKCNNPAGHGHNYRLEPCVELSVSPESLPSLTISQIEAVVDRTLIARFDHTHLNEDTKEFGLPDGVNPSVENIARVFFDLLAPEIRAESDGTAQLRSITVWETDRTCATYPG